jgi:type IV pilus assembly protein PilY1
MNRFIKSVMAAALALLSGGAATEDIDLFLGADNTNAPAPNVLILIDNTANWSQAFTAEMTALAASVNGLTAGKVRLGFMLYTETGGGNGNTDGAYVRAAVRTMDATNKPKYQTLVNRFDVTADKSNNGKLGLTMVEVYRYFKGTTAYAGADKVKRDYAGNALPLNISNQTHQEVAPFYSASNAIYALSGNAFTGAASTTYVSPWDPSGCQANFVIFLSNGKSNANTNDNREAQTKLSDAGGNTTAIPLNPSGYQDDIADEWTRFLANPPNTTYPKVITYTIDVKPTQSGQWSTDYQALLRSMATQGKGKYFYVGTAGDADLGAKLQVILESIFGEIAAVNTAFSSASLPVSVNTQGVYLNQVFIGMFRPDAEKYPRWPGNLKQYQIRAESDGTLKMADSNNDAAINPLTGFITPCARSYWTPTAADTYWTFKEGEFASVCTTVSGAAASNTPDGAFVEKGAAGYRLRATAPTSRVVKTCTGDCTALSNFDTANTAITADALGVATDDRTALINWARGQNLQNERNNSMTTEMRPSIHGDVVHSQPLAVDYGGTTGVVTFYGGNDGMLHAVEGNKTLTDGDELWSFVAPENLKKFKRLWNNCPTIIYPAKMPSSLDDWDASCGGCNWLNNWLCYWHNTTGNYYLRNKDYFIDGTIAGYRSVNGTSMTTWVYATMRRGGRRIYAFDVSTPSSPSLLWRRGCPNGYEWNGTQWAWNDTGCDTGFEQMGQTWSTVQTFYAAGYTNDSDPPALKPLAIFGGGYSVCEDNEPNTCSAPKGNRLYVVDAQTGSPLKTLDTIRSVVADVTVVDITMDGKADLAYAVDSGGNLYRLNIGTAAPADWTLTQVAALGCDAPPCAASGTLNRKFLFAPEVVATSSYYAILVGSGDREHPRAVNQAATVDNAFFMVKDQPGTANWLSAESANCSQSLICVASLLKITPEGDNPTAAQLSAKKGWYLAFGEPQTTGDTADHDKEQVVTAGLVVGGVVYFSTHTPTARTAQQCGPNLGTARAYAVMFTNAADPGGTKNRSDVMAGGGLPPSPVGGMVEIDGKVYPFVIGGRQLKGGTSSGLEVQNAGLSVAGVRTRTYWYIEPPQ